MQPASRRVPGSDGLALHLLEWSESGEPLFLLHGFGHDAHVWDEVAPPLTQRYRVLALDARGHGASDRDPDYRYHHASIARDVAAVVEHLALDRLVLVGHSMGGYAAIRFAAKHPARLMRLVLVDAGPELSASPRAQAEVREPLEVSYASFEAYERVLARRYARAAPATLARLARHWLRPRGDGRFVPRLDPAFLKPRSEDDPENRRAFDRRQWAERETARLWECLEKIPCPTLVVRGEDSPMLSPETVDRMVNHALGDARAVSIPAAGHAVMLENPAALGAALAGFLLQVRVG